MQSHEATPGGETQLAWTGAGPQGWGSWVSCVGQCFIWDKTIKHSLHKSEVQQCISQGDCAGWALLTKVCRSRNGVISP